jgi:hypothetical protein
VWSVLVTVIGCGAPEERLEANSNEGQASIYRRKRRESLGELWSGIVPRTCNKHYSRLVLFQACPGRTKSLHFQERFHYNLSSKSSASFIRLGIGLS